MTSWTPDRHEPSDHDIQIVRVRSPFHEALNTTRTGRSLYGHEPTFPYVRTPRKAGWFARAWAAFMRQESFLVRFWTAFGLLYVLALLVTWLMR
jgi:hypothetical protein